MEQDLSPPAPLMIFFSPIAFQVKNNIFPLLYNIILAQFFLNCVILILKNGRITISYGYYFQ